jgi:hypothetical protein
MYDHSILELPKKIDNDRKTMVSPTPRKDEEITKRGNHYCGTTNYKMKLQIESYQVHPNPRHKNVTNTFKKENICHITLSKWDNVNEKILDYFNIIDTQFLEQIREALDTIMMKKMITFKNISTINLILILINNEHKTGMIKWTKKNNISKPIWTIKVLTHEQLIKMNKT